MPKTLILLHQRADYNTNDIWRAAINLGYSTQRVSNSGPIDIPENTTIRYYGNTLQVQIIGERLPIGFYPIDLSILANTPLTKRKVVLTTLESLKDKEYLSDLRSIPHFIKPAQEKWFPAKIYQPYSIPVPIEGYGSLPSDMVYVQESVDMINEVRCFCLDGKILTASYYRIGHEYCPIGLDDVDRPSILDDMVAELAPFYPRGIVLDFAYTNKREWVFIEPNESFASGVYSSNPEKCLEVICASQYEK